MTFQLHAQLQQDTIKIAQFKLSQLLLMNDSQFPWFILVPERQDVSEIYQLSATDQQLLLQESCLLARFLADSYHADKMNIASIGNIVPQLHVHHIVRYNTDIAWPAPVWGKFPAVPYTEVAIQEIRLLIQALTHKKM